MFFRSLNHHEFNIIKLKNNNPVSMSYIVNEGLSLKKENFCNINDENDIDMSDMFFGCSDELSIKQIQLENLKNKI